MAKNLPADAGDAGDVDLIPGLGCRNIVKANVAQSRFEEARKTLFMVTEIEKRELSLSSNLQQKERAGEFLRARIGKWES